MDLLIKVCAYCRDSIAKVPTDKIDIKSVYHSLDEGYDFGWNNVLDDVVDEGDKINWQTSLVQIDEATWNRCEHQVHGNCFLRYTLEKFNDMANAEEIPKTPITYLCGIDGCGMTYRKIYHLKIRDQTDMCTETVATCIKKGEDRVQPKIDEMGEPESDEEVEVVAIVKKDTLPKKQTHLTDFFPSAVRPFGDLNKSSNVLKHQDEFEKILAQRQKHKETYVNLVPSTIDESNIITFKKLPKRKCFEQAKKKMSKEVCVKNTKPPVAVSQQPSCSKSLSPKKIRCIKPVPGTGVYQPPLQPFDFGSGFEWGDLIRFSDDGDLEHSKGSNVDETPTSSEETDIQEPTQENSRFTPAVGSGRTRSQNEENGAGEGGSQHTPPMFPMDTPPGPVYSDISSPASPDTTEETISSRVFGNIPRDDEIDEILTYTRIEDLVNGIINEE